MKIYISHSKNFDYKKELYLPIKNSDLFAEHEFVFPHEDDVIKNSKEIITNCDLVIAEVSFASIGVGIELGWTQDLGVKVVCIYKKNSSVSEAVKFITNTVLEYSTSKELIQHIITAIKK